MHKIKKRGAVIDSNEEEPIEIKVVESRKERNLENSSKEKKPKDSSQNSPQNSPQKSSQKTPKTEKPKKAKKKSEEEKERYSKDLISKMRELYNKDIQLSKEMKLANNKIDSIEELSVQIIRKETQENLIKAGILTELKLWLEPLPDNSLPNQKIKRSILDLLQNLRLEKADLLESGIGKIVHFYSKNSREAVELRKKAAVLIKKWKRMILKEETIDF